MITKGAKMRCRVFSFSDRVCPGHPTGGPAGVNYRLLSANKKYGYIDNMIHVFRDMIIADGEPIKISVNEDTDIQRLKKCFIDIDNHYNFSSDDVYIFHDVFSASVFYALFKLDKTILVYHQQGSLYKEWEYISGKQDKEMKKKLDTMLINAIYSVKYLAFPSKGAKESLIASEPCLEPIVNKAEIKVLYNGCDRPEAVETSSEVVDKIISLISVSNEPVFITVAILNEAKGVERIPEFLAQVKNKYGSFKWIVIGNGIKADELSENIVNYGIEDNTIWIKNKLPHDDVLALFMYTDFYIVTHRFSIFDFSTIEAMGYGNIPILTPVGGNKEVILNNNGIFLENLSSSIDFDKFIEKESIEKAKIKNMKIVDELFSEKSFLKGYSELIEELRKQ